MKILNVVLNNFLNDSRVLKESQSLNKAGHTVTVVALHENGLLEKEIIQGIAVRRIKLKTKQWPTWRFVQLIKYFEFVIRVCCKYSNNDVIHCNDLNALPIGCLIKFFNRQACIVYDAHEFEIDCTPDESPLAKKIKYLIEKSLIRYADKVITVSDSIANEYVKLYNIEKPSLVLNCPEYIASQPISNILRDKFDLNEEDRIFIYQGALTKGRGIELLINVFSGLECSKAKLVFMGYGALEDDVNSACIASENIYYMPAVPPSEVLKYTASADVGISMIEAKCKSYEFCLPNKMFEYIMAGIPVLASDLPEMQSIINKYKVGKVIKDGCEQSLVDAVLEFSEERFLRYGDGIEHARNTFNWGNQEIKLLDVYSSFYNKFDIKNQKASND